MFKRIVLSALMVFVSWSVATASHAGLSINLPGFGLHLPLPGVGISVGLPVVAGPAYPDHYRPVGYAAPVVYAPAPHYIQGQFYGGGYGEYRQYGHGGRYHRNHDHGRHYYGHGGHYYGHGR